MAPRSQAERVLGSRRTFLQSQEVLRLQVLEHIARVGQASDGPAQVGGCVEELLAMLVCLVDSLQLGGRLGVV